MSLLAHITLFPMPGAAEIQSWWLDDDGLHPCGDGEVADGDFPVIALVPAETALLRWHEYDGLAPRQAEAAARIDAAERSIDCDKLHIVAQSQGDGKIVSATINHKDFQSGLALLAASGIEPDVVVPFGMAVEDDGTGYVRASLGTAAVLRGHDKVLPDDPALRDTLAGGAPIRELTQAELAASLQQMDAAPLLNLRTDSFAKRSSNAVWNSGRLKLAAMLLGAGLLASLLLALATLWQVDRAIGREDEKTLVAARKLSPDLTDAAQAPARLSQLLAARGQGNRSFTLPAAALWAALQKAQGVNLRDMRYGGDGILSATVTAAAVDPVNKFLIDIQQQGYKITATPRQEANGVTAVAITVRAS